MQRNTIIIIKLIEMKYLILIYLIVLAVCLLEAYFCTETADDDFEN